MEFSSWIHQEFNAQRTKYRVLPNSGIFCRTLGGTQGYEFSCIRAQFLLCRLVSYFCNYKVEYSLIIV